MRERRHDFRERALHARPCIQLIATATERVSTRRTSPSGTPDEEARSTTLSCGAGASAIVAASVSTTTAVQAPRDRSRIERDTSLLTPLNADPISAEMSRARPPPYTPGA